MKKLLPLLLVLAFPGSALAGPAPGTPEYVQRDAQNIADAYGRQTGPNGQLTNPAFHPSLVVESTENGLNQLRLQAENPTRPALTPGNVFPGWNTGNPLRRGWNGTRGRSAPVAYENRYGALIRGTVFAPLPGARDPYSGAKLKGPFPGVVITTGSVQGSERMYWWLAQDLAERGYVVMTYDVQGQGTSETFPHQGEQMNALPFCNPFAEPQDEEQFGCPGVPAQQPSNFVHGTTDALDFFLSAKNPYAKLVDRRPDKRTATPGRTTRVAIVGHSLGASAVSQVQGTDERVGAVVALDKLQGGTPKVPALAIQSEYGFTVSPYWMSRGSSIAPQPGPPDEGPDPQREKRTGFDRWKAAGVDSMLIVPRASTHLEYTDIAYVLPASRYGQALTSVYTQAWLDRYLKHRKDAPLRHRRFAYLEPVAEGRWERIELDRDALLSFYYCSAYDIGAYESADIGSVGGC